MSQFLKVIFLLTVVYCAISLESPVVAQGTHDNYQDNNPEQTVIPPTTFATFELTLTDTPLPTEVPTVTETLTLTQTVTDTPAATASEMEIPQLVASFEYIITDDGTVQFTDVSTGVIDHRVWNFGDGTFSTDLNPTHQFAPGSYEVSLTVSSGEFYQIVARTVVVSAPLIAQFTATDAGAYLLIQFTNTSEGNINSYYWEFGDGESSTETNPLHQYSQEGTYTILLTVYGTDGSSTTQGDLFVGKSSNDPFTINFTADPQSGSAPLTVQFAANSSDSASFIWDFGDGSSDEGANPTHTFIEPGTYNITLTGSNPTATTSTTGIILVLPAPNPPIAKFSVNPLTGEAPLDVTFSDLSSGDISEWSYALPDGTTLNSPTVSYRFNEPGAYTVILTVSGPGGIDQTSQTIYVTSAHLQPTAEFLYELQPPYDSFSVRFGSFPSQNAVGFNWDFGDGTTSNEPNPLHNYPSEGIYAVTLEVTSISGDTATASHQVSIVKFDGPTALYEVFAQTPDGTSIDEDPLAFQFHNTSWPGTTEIMEYAWDFGDGSQSNERDPAHRFSGPGNYEVTLRVQDANGLESRYQSTIDVHALNAQIQCPGFAVNLGDAVAFFAQSWGTIPVSWLWNFGDNTTGEGQTPEHTYDVPGLYQVHATVFDADGNSATASCQVYILAPNEIIAYFETSPNGLAPLNMSLTNKSVGNIVSQEWDFGDGTTSSDANPAPHTYPNPGSYSIQLTVYDNQGHQSTYERTVHAYEPLQIDFTASPEIGIAPAHYSFEAITSQPVNSLTWQLADGIDRYGQRVSTVYFEPGDYEVTLTASSPAGTATVTKTIHVYPSGNINVALRPDRSWGIAPQATICFVNLSSGDIDTYSWDFGDGSNSSDFETCHTYESGGTYIVSLTATGSGGAGHATTSVQIYDITPSLLHIVYQQEDGNKVCFYTDDNGLAAAWEWQLDAETMSQDNNPCYIYPAPGTYRVELKLTLTNGTTQYLVSDIYIISSGTLVPSTTPYLETETPPFLPTLISTPTPLSTIVIHHLPTIVLPTEIATLPPSVFSTFASPSSMWVFQTNTPYWITSTPETFVSATPTALAPTETSTPISTSSPMPTSEVRIEPTYVVEPPLVVTLPPEEKTDSPIPVVIIGIVTTIVIITQVGTTNSCVNGIIQGSGIGVNLRSGPGLSYSTITAFPDGTTFVACAKCYADGYTWMRVTIGSRSGWMASNWSNVDVTLLPDECPDDTIPPVESPNSVTVPPALCTEAQDERNALINAMAAEQQAKTRYDQAAAEANYWRQLANQANQQATMYARRAWECARQIPSATADAAWASTQQALAALNVAAAVASLIAAQILEGVLWAAYQAVNLALGWIAAQPWGGWAREQIENAYRAYEDAHKSREWWEEELKCRQDDYNRKAEDAARKWQRLADLIACVIQSAALAAVWTVRAAYYWMRWVLAKTLTDILWLMWQAASNTRKAAELYFDEAQEGCDTWSVQFPTNEGFTFVPRTGWNAGLPQQGDSEGLNYPEDPLAYAYYKDLCQTGRGANPEAGDCPNLEDKGKGSSAKSLADVLDLIVVHHVGDSNHSVLLEDVKLRKCGSIPKLLQILAQENGLADVEYHYMVDADGTVYEGRPINVRGRHVICLNTGAVGIVLLGDFDEHSDKTSDPDCDYLSCPMIESTKKLINWLKRTYTIPEVKGHRELLYQKTVCPGSQIMIKNTGPCNQYDGQKIIDIFKNA